MASDLPLKNSCLISWAQRNDKLFLIAEIEDFDAEELTCNGNRFILKGSNKVNRFDVEFELFADLKWEEHKKVESSRHVELVIPKVTEEWWPRLLKATGKVHWVKIDFAKYMDEEEANEADAEGEDQFGSSMGKNIPPGFQFNAMDDIGNFGEDDGEDEPEDAEDEPEEVEVHGE